MKHTKTNWTMSQNNHAFASDIPTQEEINNIEVGLLALNCFGNLVAIKAITYRGTDINGKAYAGVKLDNGSHGSTITETYKEGQEVFGVTFNRQLKNQ